MWQNASYLAATYEQFQPLPEDILKIIPISIGSYKLVRLDYCKLNYLNKVKAFEIQLIPGYSATA